MRKTIKILLIAAGLFIAATPVISIADDEIMDEEIVGIEEDSDVPEEESALGLSDKNSDEIYDDLDGLIEVISETQVYEGLTMEDIILPSPQMQVPAEALSPILNVTTTEKTKVTVLSGQGEQDMSAFTKLLENIWDVTGDYVEENTLTVYIKRLRDKIEEEPNNPEFIKTIRGIGYVIEND